MTPKKFAFTLAMRPRLFKQYFPAPEETVAQRPKHQAVMTPE
jgi:hypothetical protein